MEVGPKIKIAENFGAALLLWSCDQETNSGDVSISHTSPQVTCHARGKGLRRQSCHAPHRVCHFTWVDTSLRIFAKWWVIIGSTLLLSTLKIIL